MKVLVTGGAGFIGSNLVDGLLKKGYEVRILDNLEKPTHLNGKPKYLPKEAEFIEGDMRNKDDLLKGLDGVEGIFHLAATGGFSSDIVQYVHSNSYGTALMLELIKQKKFPIKKMVVASSIAVYGEGKYQCKEHGVFYPAQRQLEQLKKGDWSVKCDQCHKPATALATDEKSPPSLNTIYGITKYDQERMILCVGKSLNIPSVALRFFVTFGPRQSVFNPYTGVCSIFSTRILNGKPPIIYEDGDQTRDFVFVEDVVNAAMIVFENPDADYKVFNVGSGKTTSVKSLAEHLIKAYGKTMKPLVNGEFRLGDVRTICADLTALRKLGYEPKFSLEEGLKRYVAWIESQGSVKEYFEQAQQHLKQQGLIHSKE
jgi:dTDP-L-rhamnose 4-epimerase